ncbi:tetratricopeptide repeat protein [Corallococcus sicarius]|uniref:Uncharacterized protein n=1 Tax=Corallococcus sicarius TaxID=2316726 RepID=A0A3A8NU82_9BACT|nr:hypothetical protein [Corallococcus sicarius]RKH47019.1 hypothetical protein D7X12_03835 [Corallococcus sicarius]
MSLTPPSDPSGLLERAPRLAQMLPDEALASALARGDAWTVRAVLVQRLQHEPPGPTRELLAALVEDRAAFVTTVRTPRMRSVLGTGLQWQGRPPPEAPQAPFVATRTVSVLGLSVWPLDDYLVRGGTGAPLQVIGQVPPPAGRGWRRAGVVAGVVLGVCLGAAVAGVLLDARKVRAVSVINGLSRPVEVSIGTQRWVVAPGTQEQGRVKLEDAALHARASWPGAARPFEDVVLPTDGERLIYNVRGAAMLEGHRAFTADGSSLERRPLTGTGELLFPEEVLSVAQAHWESTVRAHMDAGDWRLAGRVASAVAEVDPLNPRARELAARCFLLAEAQAPAHLPDALRSRDTVGFANMLMQRWQEDLGAQSLAQDLHGFVGTGAQARARYIEHAKQFPDSPLAHLYLTRANTRELPLAQALPAYEELARRFPNSPEAGLALLEVRWLHELEDPRPPRQPDWDPSKERVLETARLADPLVERHPPRTVEALELLVRVYLRAWRRDAATALVHRFGLDPRNRSWDFLVLAGRVANVAGPAHTPYVLRDWIPAAMSRQPERMLLLDLLTGQRLPKDAELAALSPSTDRDVLRLTRDVLTRPTRAREQAAKASEAVLSRLEPEVAALLALELTRTGDAQAKRLFQASLPLVLAREPLLKFLQAGTVTPAFSRLPQGLRAAALLVRARGESKEGFPVFTARLEGLEGLDALQGFAPRAADAWLRGAFDACRDTKVPDCEARVVRPTGRPLPKARKANGADP